MKKFIESRLLFLFGGMIYLNIFFSFLKANTIDDNWLMIYYILLNLLWIDFVRVSTKKVIKEVMEETK
jgi:divalent metal cation (Fe/Co/Zn/Cd) transporter